MASRIIHLAVSKLLADNYDVGDKNLFCLGSVLPDAVAKERSHFFKFFDGGTRKTYDLTGFRNRYPGLSEGGLYLGYYMHLIQDIVFRDYFYHTVGYVPTSEKLKQLHLDYSLINSYVIGRYGITELPAVPDGLGEDPLLKEKGIDPSAFIGDMRGDLSLHPEGEPVYFTRAFADEYIARAEEVCGQELRALSGEGEHINEDSFSWLKHN
ncbi:hypothetical protein SAMN02910317_01108 [Ruminococcaceae bacterium FB2012]|nr:hypothetical protein SAMN02910317_01108 [Ruminococcaceae bacterium FB2012]